jgi:hypothetical protein
MIDLDEPKLEKDVEKAREVYVWEYKKRYSLPPVVADKKIAYGILRDLIRAQGIEKSIALIKKYLAQNDNHYVQNKHSLRVLSDSVAAINAALASPKGLVGRVPLSISLNVFCDRCGRSFVWVGPADEVGSKTQLCEPCSR